MTEPSTGASPSSETVDPADGGAPPPVPDLRVVIDPEPRRAARRLATELSAGVVEGSVAAEDLVRQRLALGTPSRAEVDEAVRLAGALEGFDAEHDRELAARVHDLRPLVRRRAPNHEDLMRLRRLDEQLPLLARVIQRTEGRAAEDLTARLGVGNRTGVPAGTARPSAFGPRAPLRSAADIRRPPRTGALMAEAMVVLLGVIVAAAVVGAGFSPVIGAGSVLLALVVVFALDRHSRRVAATATRDRRTALEALVQSAAANRPLHSDVSRASADPSLESPQRLDDRAHAPRLDPVAVQTAPAVGATGAAFRQGRADWRVTWAGLGRDAPEPHSEESAAALLHLAARVEADAAVIDVNAPARLAAAEASLVRVRSRQRLSDLLGPRSLSEVRRAAANPVDDRPVILVEPFTDLGVRRAAVLRRQLRELRHADRVFAVVTDPSHVPVI